MKDATHAEPVMGTVVTFDVRNCAEDLSTALVEVVAWLHWVDATFSTYKHDSEISRLDRGELHENDCHPDVREILALCAEMHATTGGYFDARATGRLDPSGVVKGWSIERASMLLTAAGWPDHAINGGGDVRLRGGADERHAWQVGITHPFALDSFCAVLSLSNGAVATSGTYERGFHVFDPHRGTPAMDLAAVTVIGPDLIRADAYATAAMAMGSAAPEWLAGLSDHEAYLIDSDGQGWSTAGFDRYRLDARAR